MLRSYLARRKWQLGAFFGDLGPGSGDAELLDSAAEYPVFRLDTVHEA